MPKIKALVLGCGNIGAMYDLHTPEVVQTHARAFSWQREIEFSVTDSDQHKAKLIGKRYNVQALKLNQVDFNDFSIVSLTTPTKTHFFYLKQMLRLNVPVVVCEKPVAADLAELSELKRIYLRSQTKVLVNYMRRFQPGYAVLKRRVQKILKQDTIESITITYQQGMLNNSTHATDLLEYLFNAEFRFHKFIVQSAAVDIFPDDPTISGTCLFDGVPVNFAGITDTVERVFEIELLFQNFKIIIDESGNTIGYFRSEKSIPVKEFVRMRQTKLLTNYMQPVISKAMRLLLNSKEEDNFMLALALNQRTVRLIEKIKTTRK